MGEINGFVCLNCQYEESYFVGFGFRVREEKVLFACYNCETLTSTNAKTPRCRKCRSRRITEVKDVHSTAKCQECNHEGVLEEGGCWD